MSHACSHADAHGSGLDGSTLADALAQAEARSVEVGERLTAPRRRVLELLLEAGQPVKAYDLMASFGEPGAPAKPPTVYRALEFLARLGLAHRIESLNAYVACRAGEDGHAATFLICECCGATEEVEVALSPVEAAAAERGYAVRALTVEARGLCGACRA